MRRKHNDLFDRPYMLTDPRFHSRSDPQGLMHTHEIVVHVKQSNRVNQVINLLAERVGQTSEPPIFIRILRFWRST